MSAVVVVGGGVAGLACAWRLQQAGHDVEVLEREPAAGGRMRSERHGAYVVDRGAQFVASGYRNLHAVAGALGVDALVGRLARTRNAVLRAGRFEPGDYASPLALLRSRLLSFGAKARLPLVLLELRRARALLDPLHPELAAPLDGEDLPAFVRRTAGEEAFEYLFAPAFSSTFDCEPEQLSGAFALLALRFLAGGFRLQAFEGGNGAFTRALAASLSVRTGCEVVSIETQRDGARVRYRTAGGQRSVFADAAVVAVPGSQVAALCPRLVPAEREFFAGVHYGSGIIAYLCLERAPASLPYYGVAFPRREGIGLYGLAADHQKPGAAPRGAGLVNAALTADAAARLWSAPDDAVAAHVVDALARTPVGKLRPTAAVVHRHAPMLPQFRPGYLGRLARFQARAERSPRLAFAGDYLIGPYTEAALTSGLRAAEQLEKKL